MGPLSKTLRGAWTPGIDALGYSFAETVQLVSYICLMNKWHMLSEKCKKNNKIVKDGNRTPARRHTVATRYPLNQQANWLAALQRLLCRL